jgi:hypothetical protein
MTQDQINREDLKELASYYGGWAELREVISQLEEEEDIRKAENSEPDFDAVSSSEQAEIMHRYQRDLK